MSTRADDLYETDAIVLRTIRFGEADAILSLLTLDRGRVSAIAKGARRPTSKLGGRLQPGARLRITLVQGRGDLATVRTAQMTEAHAGLWVEGYRLLAASSVLEAVHRVTPEHEASPEAYHLLRRALDLLARAAPRTAEPHLDPVVLATLAKLLVVAGILPRLADCASCGAVATLQAFSAHAGGALCGDCAHLGEPLPPGAVEGMRALVGAPLADAAGLLDPAAAAGVERLVTMTFREHMGVTLRAATTL